jgi:hypothetical protein
MMWNKSDNTLVGRLKAGGRGGAAFRNSVALSELAAIGEAGCLENVVATIERGGVALPEGGLRGDL